MSGTALVETLRSAPLKPVRNLLRPLASAFPVPVGVKMAGGRILYVDLRSAIGRGILVRGEFDPAVGSFLAERLFSGAVFADVGANVGYFSLAALGRVGAGGEVHSFEIDPRSLACLYRTQRANRFENLFVHGVGLGDHAAIVRIAAEAEMGNTHVSSGACRGGPGFPMLPLDTWDGYFEQRGLHLIKIDVEGAELGVLRGARRILERNRPVVLCEAIEPNLARFGYSVAALSHFMEGIGYKPAVPLRGSHDCNLVFEP